MNSPRPRRLGQDEHRRQYALMSEWVGRRQVGFLDSLSRENERKGVVPSQEKIFSPRASGDQVLKFRRASGQLFKVETINLPRLDIG